MNTKPATPKTQTHTFENGLTVIGEPMADKQAAAWALLLPVGSATEPAARSGITNVLESLCYRGAGGKDARGLSEALDDLGVDRGGGSDVELCSFGGATFGDYLPGALALYADIVRRPALAENEWQPQRELALQALQSLEDVPARKMFEELRRVYFPGAHGRSPLGTQSGLESITLDDLKADHAARFLPQGAVLTLAGNFKWETVLEQVSTLFADWNGTATQPGEPVTVDQPVYQHMFQETAQQHIGVAWPGLPSGDEHHYDYRIAMSILSGGMGARLFTEVREKRGLVYSVSASAATYRGCGYNMAYAGTTPERSQETLDVLLHELQRIAEGVTADEVERARIGMISSLIMQEESSRARAATLARDQFILGRVRTLDEITEAINRVTPESIAAFYKKNQPRDFTVVTLGPSDLKVSQIS